MKNFSIVLFFLLFAGITAEGVSADNSADSLQKQRRALAQKPRLSFNNDGCDVLYFPASQTVTRKNLLDLRTSNLPKTDVTTLTYCSISAGFGLFTHQTKKGEFLTRCFDPANTKSKNIAGDLAQQGKDVLQLMTEFCHQNRMECFWSMRMNDTHDAASRPGNYSPLFPQLKKDHPEWLVGKIDNRTKYGAWSSVNYAQKEIRDLAVAYVQEVCRNYDIDGIELDFCRHLTYFPSAANGGEATAEECAMMTDLLRRMRAVTDQEALRRGRPILLTVRVPDCVEYGRKIGLDFESWMKENLADIYIGSDYFQLNSIDVWASLGKKYHAVVYAGLSESRVKNQDKRFNRNSSETYAARAMNAWRAGVQGVHIFNVYTATAPFLSFCGSIEHLTGVDKYYFATTQYGGYRPTSYLKTGEEYRKTPLLSPDTPWTITADEPKTLELPIYETSEKAPGGSDRNATIFAACRLEKKAAPDSICLVLNGKEYKTGKVNEKWSEWLDFPLKKEDLRSGRNTVEFRTTNRQIVLKDFLVVFDY